MFILDETGADRRNVLGRYAYSWRGKPAQSHRLLVRGDHLSSVAFMSTRGVLDCKVVHGSADGDKFYEIVRETLLPHLMPFNGSNPHSVMVMDASIHHVEGIREMINSVGALLLYLPPYSPDYNPIEELFSKLKSSIKIYEQECDAQEMDIEDIVYAAYSHITPEDCQSWIADSHLYCINSIEQCVCNKSENNKEGQITLYMHITGMHCHKYILHVRLVRTWIYLRQ